MPDFRQYCGVPFVEGGRDVERDGGLDCFGLARLVLREQFGIVLDEWNGVNWSRHNGDDRALGRLIRRQAQADGWRKVMADTERPGDVALIWIGDAPVHLGVVIGGRDMLHVQRGIESRSESYASIDWRQRRKEFWRYIGQE